MRFSAWTYRAHPVSPAVAGGRIVTRLDDLDPPPVPPPSPP
jgi:hypothetical protein